MRTGFRIRRFLAVLTFGLLVGVPSGMAQPEMRTGDVLARFNDILQKAGISALTSSQETSLNALIAEFRSVHHSPPQNTVIQNARTAYETAILNGDAATAASQAAIIGNAQTAEMIQRDTDAAVFGISAINILRTNSAQFSALISQMGENGVVRLILGLVGGPGGFGPRGGPGPGGPGGPPKP